VRAASTRALRWSAGRPVLSSIHKFPVVSIKQPLVGMCPDLEIYDLRVLPDDPEKSSDEFTIIAALQ
jgi:hypothetical protein